MKGSAGVGYLEQLRKHLFAALNLMISLASSIGHESASDNPTRKQLVLWLSVVEEVP
jgi:hypothetical protein